MTTTGSTPRTSGEEVEGRITSEYAMTILSWIAPGEPIRLTKRELVALLDGVTMDYLALLDERAAATQRAERLETALKEIRAYDTEDGHGTIIEGMVNAALNDGATDA